MALRVQKNGMYCLFILFLDNECRIMSMFVCSDSVALVNAFTDENMRNISQYIHKSINQ